MEYGALIMSSSGGGDSVRFSTYITDSAGRLTRIIDSNNRKPHLYFTDLYYDTSGRVYKYVLSSNTGLWGEEFSFEYDQSGRIIRQYHKKPSGMQLWNAYTYDAKGRLISDSRYQFTYDQNDNVTEVNHIGYGKTTMSYSTVINPFTSFQKIQYYLARQNPQLYAHDYLFLTKHQPTTMVFSSGNLVSYQLHMLTPERLGSFLSYWGSSTAPGETKFYYQESPRL